MLGLCRDNGKENGNYSTGVTLGLYWGYIGLRVAEEGLHSGNLPQKDDVSQHWEP